MEYLNIDSLRKEAKMIHWFGLGFVQIKLNDTERIHFYTDKLPRTTTEEEIHNHRYNFVSRILKGELFQTLFDVEIIPHFTTDNKFWLVDETCKETEKKSFPTFPCNVSEIFNFYYPKGHDYYIHHETFHRVWAREGTITHVIRSKYKKDVAQVVFPVGTKPQCPFSVKKSEPELWEVVRECLK